MSEHGVFYWLNEIMDFLIKGPEVLGHVWWHLLLGSFMGLSGFFLMLIISSALYRKKGLGILWEAHSAVVFITIGYSLLVGLSLALHSHALLDGLFTWYTAPQNPPLNLDIPDHLK